MQSPLPRPARPLALHPLAPTPTVRLLSASGLTSHFYITCLHCYFLSFSSGCTDFYNYARIRSLTHLPTVLLEFHDNIRFHKYSLFASP